MTPSLAAINIYPVKGLGSMDLDESLVTNRGLQFDRRFMVVGDDDAFVTQRSVPKMATVGVTIEHDAVILSAPGVDSIAFSVDPEPSVMRNVRVWDDQVPAHAISSAADEWLARYLGCATHLVHMPDSSDRPIESAFAEPNQTVSFADGYPLLIASEESLADLNSRIISNGGAAIPMSRFRPNLVIKGCDPYAEDQLGEISVGGAVFRAVKPCTRCQVTTTDQQTGEVLGPEPLRTLAGYRKSPGGVIFGMNLIPLELGMVRVGDSVSWSG